MVIQSGYNMHKIKNIAFDLGGVVISLSYEKAVKRFEEIGLHEAHKHLDAFCQQGIFGDLGKGLIPSLMTTGTPLITISTTSTSAINAN